MGSTTISAISSEGRRDPWIDLRCEVGCCRTATTAAFRHAGYDPAWLAAADDCWPAQGVVAAGLGLALIPPLALGVTHADVAVRRLHPEDEPTREIIAVIRPAIRDTPTVSAMLDILTSAAREQARPSQAAARRPRWSTHPSCGVQSAFRREPEIGGEDGTGVVHDLTVIPSQDDPLPLEQAFSSAYLAPADPEPSTGDQNALLL